MYTSRNFIMVYQYSWYLNFKKIDSMYLPIHINTLLMKVKMLYTLHTLHSKINFNN